MTRPDRANRLKTALRDLLAVISADDLIDESISYMRQARAALLDAEDGSAEPTVDHKALYFELLYQVATKHPDETRHQTALRYIAQAERRDSRAVAATQPTEEK